MITWNNLDTLESFKELSNVKKVNLVEAMTGENGMERSAVNMNFKPLTECNGSRYVTPVSVWTGRFFR